MSELEELRKQKDQAYWERNQLVAALSKLYPAWLSRHEESDTAWEQDWKWISLMEIRPGGHSEARRNILQENFHNEPKKWSCHIPVTKWNNSSNLRERFKT